MKIFLKTLIVLTIALLLSGCITLSNYPMHTQLLGTIDKSNKNITFLNTSYFIPNMVVALAKYGFTIKPAPSEYTETVTKGSKTIKFDHASARYGLTLYTQWSDMKCVFSSNRMVRATLMVTDLKTGKLVLTLQQEGADGPCPPIPPIWDGLAAKMATYWEYTIKGNLPIPLHSNQLDERKK